MRRGGGSKFLALWALAFSFSSVAIAQQSIPALYVQVAEQYGIPPENLFALAKTESQTELNIGNYPWPWTLNIAGRPARYPTELLACAALKQALLDTSGKLIDIGLAQLNWGWVAASRFLDPCEALDPFANLSAAAMLLRQYYEVTGNWIDAAGKYHRPAGGAIAQRYKQAYRKYLPKVSEYSIDQ